MGSCTRHRSWLSIPPPPWPLPLTRRYVCDNIAATLDFSLLLSPNNKGPGGTLPRRSQTPRWFKIE